MSTPSISIVEMANLARTSRRLRTPTHVWQVRHKPWTIQPVCIAPVQAGETMTSASFKARVVSDPMKNPLIGAWIEYYWFYVKLRDLDARDTITQIMIDPTKNLTSLHSAAKTETYHYAGSVDWTQLCLDRIVQEYFRDEGEPLNGYGGDGVIGGMPIAKAVPGKTNMFDSAIRDDDVGSVNDLTDPHSTDVMTQYQAAYDKMRAARMIDMTFDEWLGTFGIHVRTDEQQHIPELLRYHKTWTYPANTIEPTTGMPSSAYSWAVSGDMEKDRLFREPGFIVGVSVFRPKIYLKGQTGSGVGMLDTAESWLPALLGDQPWSSLRKFAATASGPISGQGASPANDYWIDVRDLFMYGDQFVNFALTETDAGLVALPRAGLERQYVLDADRNALFVDAVTKCLVRQDGIIDLRIKGSPLTTVDQT